MSRCLYAALEVKLYPISKMVSQLGSQPADEPIGWRGLQNGHRAWERADSWAYTIRMVFGKCHYLGLTGLGIWSTP